jgi:hypothetical protein
MQTDIDRHGPVPPSNTCQLLDPPHFSLVPTFKDVLKCRKCAKNLDKNQLFLLLFSPLDTALLFLCKRSHHHHGMATFSCTALKAASAAHLCIFKFNITLHHFTQIKNGLRCTNFSSYIYMQGWAKLVLIVSERYSVALNRLTFNLR